MFGLLIYLAGLLAVITATGAVLDRKKARRSRRVLVWAGVFFLLLPLSLIAFYLTMLSIYGWHYC
jgi:hypothetical protein